MEYNRGNGILTNYIDYIAESIAESLQGTKKDSNIKSYISTKCPYCGTLYEHSSYGPQVEILTIKNKHWEPTLETKNHDARQPIKCNGCGATFKLNVQWHK